MSDFSPEFFCSDWRVKYETGSDGFVQVWTGINVFEGDVRLERGARRH